MRGMRALCARDGKIRIITARGGGLGDRGSGALAEQILCKRSGKQGNLGGWCGHDKNVFAELTG